MSAYGTFQPSRSEPWKRNRRSVLGSDNGRCKPWVPRAGIHPLQPVAAPTANGSIGARGGWRGDEPERRVSYREPDLCCGVRGKVLEPSANGGSQIADRTLLARSAAAAVRRFPPFMGPL